MGEFVAALDPVYRIAERSPGFVRRLRSGEAHVATVVYRSPHGAYVRRRSRWFVPV